MKLYGVLPFVQKQDRTFACMCIYYTWKGTKAVGNVWGWSKDFSL